jgi:hypothetical protein
MTLKDYLALPGHSATKLALETGVSVSTITRAAKGKTIPDRNLMSLLAEKTKGAVMPNDFFALTPVEPQAGRCGMKPRFIARNFGPHKDWADKVAHRVEPSIRTKLVASSPANSNDPSPWHPVSVS